MESNKEKIDEMTLALLYLVMFDEKHGTFAFEYTSVNDILFDQKTKKSKEAMKPCPDRCDLEPPILLVFDKCLQIVIGNLLDVTLPYVAIESEKGAHSDEAALKSAWLVVHSPLVEHVVLKMLFVWKVQLGDLLKNTINWGDYGVLIICYFDVTDDCSEN